MSHHTPHPALVALAALGLLMAPSSSQALDTLFMSGGEKRVGTVQAIDETTVRLQVPLPPPPGAPEGTAPIFATVTVPRKDIVQIEFDPDEARDELLRKATPDQLNEVTALWRKWEPFLSFPKSPAGRIANAYGDLLLRTEDEARAAEALSLFQRIEREAWDEPSKMLARQGRLRAMVATGDAAAAVAEAVELSRITENPAVLIQAKFILAQAADQSLRELIEENPRWEEDVFVIPERDRLYNEALDEYLYPYLFLGSEAEAAAGGLLGAIGIYRFTDELPLALESARDLVSIYPGTPQAAEAQAFIDSLPEEIREFDPEREAREALGTTQNTSP